MIFTQPCESSTRQYAAAAIGVMHDPADLTSGFQRSDQAWRSNAEVDWEGFDPELYKKENYEELMEDDKRILGIIRRHFGDIEGRDLIGVDVGTGGNLYPALAMTPFCRSIDLLEYSSRNREWLKAQQYNPDASWVNFWRELAEHSVYRDHRYPGSDLAAVTTVRSGDVLRLPRTRSYDLATMFFVAESISNRKDEFDKAVHRFTGIVKPGGRFAAAFMGGSGGYRIAGASYPAVKISEDDVLQQFCAAGVRVDEPQIVERLSDRRGGYSGMIVVTGDVPK